MDGFKEFQGKDLDDAIREACEYFNAARENWKLKSWRTPSPASLAL